jgi:hypothetical protein
MWFVESYLIVLSLGIITYLAGRPLVIYLNKHKKFLPIENLCLSLLLGTFSLSYLFSIGSYCNLPGKYIGPLLLAVILLATIFFRKKNVFKVNSHIIYFILWCLVAIALSLITLFLYDSFTPYNDTIGYISISDYLYQHGFLKKYIVKSGFQPLDSLILLLQPYRARMGANFFMAAVQSIFQVQKSIAIFPVVQAWGMILVLSSITIASRWIFHLQWKYTWITLALIILTFNPIYYSIHYGFFNQIYGCALFVGVLAAFSRLVRNSNHQNAKSLVILNAVLIACLILFYPEIFPFAVLAMAFGILLPFFRQKQNKKQWLLRLLSLGLIFLAISNISFVGTIYYILSQFGGTFGWHIDLSLQGFINTALGVMPTKPSSSLANVLAAFLLLFFIIAIYRLSKKNVLKHSTWLSAVIIFAITFIYFDFFVKNPWLPGVTGQSWNMFKVVSWVYPILILGVGYGISRLKNKALIIAPLLIMVCIYVSLKSYPFYIDQALLAQNFTQSKHPFKTYTNFADVVQQLDIIQPIEILTDNRQKKILAYYLHPTPVFADWRGDPYLANLPSKAQNININQPHLKIVDQDILVIDNARSLPANTVLIDSTMSYLKYFNNFYDLEISAGGKWRWSKGEGLICFNSYKEQVVKISSSIAVTKVPASVTVQVSGNKPVHFLIEKSDWVPIEFVAKLTQGDNKIEFTTDAKPIKIGEDPRLLAFALSNLKISPAH